MPNPTYDKNKKLVKDTEYELRKMKDWIEEQNKNPVTKLMEAKLKKLFEMYNL